MFQLWHFMVVKKSRRDVTNPCFPFLELIQVANPRMYLLIARKFQAPVELKKYSCVPEVQRCMMAVDTLGEIQLSCTSTLHPFYTFHIDPIPVSLSHLLPCCSTRHNNFSKTKYSFHWKTRRLCQHHALSRMLKQSHVCLCSHSSSVLAVH